MSTVALFAVRLATRIVFTLSTLPLAAAFTSVAVSDAKHAETYVLPIIVVGVFKFGAAMVDDLCHRLAGLQGWAQTHYHATRIM